MISRDNDVDRRLTAAGPPALPRRIVIAENHIDSRELFTGTREITIAHGEDTYRLRLTAQNKLILTK
jgi:hemin uptake protein HemP